MKDFDPKTNSSRRPASKFEAARVFVECVSCGAYKVLSATVAISNSEAARRAQLSGWQVFGFKGAKWTRCSRCRAQKRRDRNFADNDPRYGLYNHVRLRRPL